MQTIESPLATMAANQPLNSALPWPATVVATLVASGGHIGLGLSGAGQANVAFWDNLQSPMGKLHFAPRDGDTWPSEIVVATQGARVAMAPDSRGEPFLAYFDLQQSQLVLARRGDDGWRLAAVVEGSSALRGAAPGDLRLQLDSQDRPVITFFADDALKIARQQRDRWRIDTVVAGPGAGFYHDLALDSRDRPVIAYHHLGREELRLVRWEEGVTEADHERIDATPATGEYVALALDDENLPHLCCWQAAGPAYFTRSDGRWQKESIEVAPPENQGLGLFSRIAIGFSRIPKVAYYDGLRGELKFAYREPDGEWQIRVVDEGGGPNGDVGGYVAMVLNRQELAQIAYYDWQNQAVKFVGEPSSLQGCLYQLMGWWHRLKRLVNRIGLLGRRLAAALPGRAARSP